MTSSPDLVRGRPCVLVVVAVWLGCRGGDVDAKVYATQMSPRVVETQFGKLRGVLIALPGSRPDLGHVEAYFGLQYASIHAGELRFMPPTNPTEKWDGIRVALKYRPVCPQRLPDLDRLEQRLPLTALNHWKRLMPFLEKQQEECLNLNIYVPLRGTVRGLHFSSHAQQQEAAQTNTDEIRYDNVCLTCSKKLTGSQHSLPHGINRQLKTFLFVKD